MAEVDLDKYKVNLITHASQNHIILLALVDVSFLDMTFNFYETSIQKFNITNYLFIAIDHQACDTLLAKNIHCYVYMTDPNANKATIFRSFDFNQKMNIRTFFILDALKFGFTILHTDVDIIFLNNPLRDLYSSVDGDLACLSDTGSCNAGFVYIKPSNFTIDVYTKMKNLAFSTKLDDQTALNKVLQSIMEKNTKVYRKKKLLSVSKYQCGLEYFEHGHRYFADSATCPQCIVVHNNWIVSKEAKRYRFREVLLWSYDDNGYYSNTTTKYLMYSNPTSIRTSTINSSNVELDALKTALFLGHVLNRVVILPRFSLTNKRERPLNNWIKMSCFDNQFFGKYRENAFFHHPKVPQNIKDDITTPFWIKTEKSVAMLVHHPSDITLLTPRDNRTATTEEIVDWFRDIKSAVLNFHSLYGIFSSQYVPKSVEIERFYRKIELAFIPTDYRQLRNLGKSCYI